MLYRQKMGTSESIRIHSFHAKHKVLGFPMGLHRKKGKDQGYFLSKGKTGNPSVYHFRLGGEQLLEGLPSGGTAGIMKKKFKDNLEDDAGIKIYDTAGGGELKLGKVRNAEDALECISFMTARQHASGGRGEWATKFCNALKPGNAVVELYGYRFKNFSNKGAA